MSNENSEVSPQPANNVRNFKKSPSLMAKFAEKFNVDPNKLMSTLKSTAFRQRNGEPPTDEQMLALMVVADQYNLNPFTKEIYAFPDAQSKGIIPVVGVDGWLRIINSHSKYNGMEFNFSERKVELKGLNEPIYEWVECIIHRTDREISTPIREYMVELYREPNEKNGYVHRGPWQSHPRRMARHKVIIQAARVVLGYAGIYDEDEADRIIEAQAKTISSQPAIEFEAETPQTAIAPPSEQSELMQDLAEADIANAEFEEVDQTVQDEQLEMSVQQEQPHPQSGNEYFDTQFGQVNARDAKMISNMVEFAQSSAAWDTTKDSFKERYSGHVLDYALNELNSAFNEAMKDFE